MSGNTNVRAIKEANRAFPSDVDLVAHPGIFGFKDARVDRCIASCAIINEGIK